MHIEKGVVVEAELGKLAGIEDDVNVKHQMPCIQIQHKHKNL